MTPLTQMRLRAMLRYYPSTGRFVWLQSPNRRIRRGATAGCSSGCRGAVRIHVDGMSHLAHRLAFLYMLGRWPRRLVDHKNGIPPDNRWRNLREATDAVNCENQRRARKDSSTGLLGVVPIGKKFIARIKANGKQIHLGTFKSPRQAHAAYLRSKRQLHEGCTI